MFTERLLGDNTKANFNQAVLDIGIPAVDNFNKVLAEMNKHVFLAYTFCKQKRYLHRHVIKPRSTNPCSFASRLQELNAYLSPPDTLGLETAPLPADEIMDIIYHSIPAKWK